jgi:dTDP-4-amino-4,6-dideoxygalactose transaminase
MTAFATYLAIVRAGAVPVLADIDPQTAMLAPDSVARCINARTKAIVLVHLYGQIGPVDELLALASRHGLQLVEDCAQAHGATLDGKPAGSFGAAGAWSFYPTKNLGCVGDGGAITTTSQALAEQAMSLRNYGQSTRYFHPLLGMNSRLDEIQAAMLKVRLSYLRDWTKRRREIAHRYQAGIRNPAIRLLPLPAQPSRHAHHLFVVLTPQRGELQRFLKDQEIEALIHYPVTIHQQESASAAARDPAGLRHAEAHAQSCLSLPCHPGLHDDEVDRVIAAVNRFGA